MKKRPCFKAVDTKAKRLFPSAQLGISSGGLQNPSRGIYNKFKVLRVMSGDMDKRRLVFSMVDFLNREMASDGISEDAKGILT